MKFFQVLYSVVTHVIFTILLRVQSIDWTHRLDRLMGTVFCQETFKPEFTKCVCFHIII